MQQILDSMSMTPAYVRNGRLDVLAANQLGAALYSDLFADPVRPAEQRPVSVPQSSGR